MHRSQLAGLVIDCQTDDLDAAVTFWSRALGLPRRSSTAPEGAGYELLQTKPNDLQVEVQKVDHPSRVHLDIETDDIEAEVRRLEGLGAKRVKQIGTWWVMEAPTGQRFCVDRPVRANFAAEANRWE
ncbi:MAG: VOC family protein [Dongiaceae bacterium]